MVKLHQKILFCVEKYGIIKYNRHLITKRGAEMEITNAYSVVPFSLYKYATIPCSEAFINVNFDNILLTLGKYCFNEPNATPNRVCALLRDRINSEWHLNRKRKSKKKISATQIKSVRRSFNRLISHDTFVRIPFDVVPIFFFILSLLKSIDNENADIQKYINDMNKLEIGQYLYKNHTEIFNNEMDNRVAHITDRDLINKYNRLNANLNEYHSIMKKHYNEIEWHNIHQYRL